jgi:lipopolysaccharide transport system ATP-binding protein
MGDVAREGRTVLFVSHNMRAVADLCERCIWLSGGQIIQGGVTQQVVLAYISSEQPKQRDGMIKSDMHINDTGHLYFRLIRLLAEDGSSVNTVFFGSPLRIHIELEVCRPVEQMRLVLAIEKLDGTLVSVFHHTDDPQNRPMDARPGYYGVHIEIQLPLTPGVYTLHLGAKPVPGYWGSGKSWDWVQRALDFCVEEFSEDGQAPLPAGGIVRPLAQWSIHPCGGLRSRLVDIRDGKKQ